jgi:uncharacterized protein (TIGR02246 family)
MRIRPWGLLGFLAFGACAHDAASPAAQATVASARAGITAQHEAWREAIIAGDAARLARLFTEDGVLLSLNGSVARGRTEVQKVLEDFLRHAKYLSGGFTTDTLDLQGDLAIEVAAFTWDRSLDGGPPTGPQKGHAMAVWHRQPDGSWLIRAWSAKYDPKS